MLPALFGEVIVPPAVLTELTNEWTPSEVRTWLANGPEWLRVQAPREALPQLKGEIDDGEREAIALAIPDELYERLQALAVAEGTTVEALVTKAIERDLARRWLERVGREGKMRRGRTTDDEIEAAVQSAVQDMRALRD